MTVQTRGRWGRRRQSPEAALKEIALRLLVAAVLLIFGLLFVRSVVENLQNSMARPAANPTTAQHPQALDRQTPRPVRNATPEQPVRQSSVPTTPEELKAWEEKNAEAMRILEKSTPSVYD